MDITQYITQLLANASRSESSSEVQAIGDKLFDYSQALKKLNASMKSDGSDEDSDLESFLEDASIKAMTACKTCGRWAEDMMEDEASERKYGDVNQQAESDYRSSQI